MSDRPHERRDTDVPAGTPRSRDSAACGARSDIRALLHELVDVVVQCGVENQRRFVREIYWKDAAAGKVA
jgi:hypothetical protein